MFEARFFMAISLMLLPLIYPVFEETLRLRSAIGGNLLEFFYEEEIYILFGFGVSAAPGICYCNAFYNVKLAFLAVVGLNSKPI
jgi:hypothetical protein